MQREYTFQAISASLLKYQNYVATINIQKPIINLLKIQREYTF